MKSFTTRMAGVGEANGGCVHYSRLSRSYSSTVTLLVFRAFC